MTTALQFAFLGIATGAVYAILAQGVVLIYRGSGVLNLSHGALAMVSAFTFNTLRIDREWSVPIALVASVTLAALIGMAVDQAIMRPLRRRSPVTRLIATLGVLLILQSVAVIKWGSTPIFVPPFIETHPVDVFGANATSYQLILLGIAVTLTVALTLFWRYSRFGWLTEAVSENQRSAAALGWSPEVVSAATWTAGGALAGLAGVLVSPITQLSVPNLTLLVIYALAASLIGGFTSFPLTLVGGLLVGVAQAEVSNYVDTIGASEALPFLFIIVVLVVRGSRLPVRGDVADRLPKVGSGRANPFVVLAATLIGLAILNVLDATEWQSAITATFATGTVLLSLVVLLGYAGQLSLGQYAIAGIGALVSARTVADHGWPLLVAVVIGTAVASLVGLVFALPALRTRGVNLAVVTLGLGLAVQAVVFNNPKYSTQSGVDVSGQTLFGWSVDPLEHPSRYAAVTFLAFVGCALLVRRLRRGRAGRNWLAVRANERSAAASGVNVLGAKLQAFGVSGAIAGLGGCLLAFSQTTATFSGFSPFASLNAVGAVVIGGAGFLMGAGVGALTVPSSVGSVIALHWQNFNTYLPLVAAAILILTVILNPDGVAEAIGKACRKAGARFRRQATPRIGAEMVVTPVPPRTLKVRGLSVRYGGVVALRDVDITLRPGTVSGLIGPNGAGKTSLMDAVSGFTPHTGTVELDSTQISTWSPHRRARAGVVRSFQALELFDDMTVFENLQVAAEPSTAWAILCDVFQRRSRDLSPAAQAAIAEFKLTEHLDRYPTELSYGQRRLVGVARAVARQPSVLLLDEPVAGLDEGESREFAQLVRRLADDWGMAVLVIEHDMDFVMSICDTLTVIDFGQQIASGAPDAVRLDPRARAAYLGASPDADLQATPTSRTVLP